MWLALASTAPEVQRGPAADQAAAAAAAAPAAAGGMEKNPKACEPCRRRKVRCNGQTPCNRCDRKPGDCVYRLRTRIRKSAAQRAAAAAAEAAAAAAATSPNNVAKAPPPQTPGSDGRSVVVAVGANGSEQPTPLPASAGHDSPSGFRRDVPEAGEGPKSDSAIYQSIAAVPQRSDVEPIQGGTARLFYGPACELNLSFWKLLNLAIRPHSRVYGVP